MTLEEFLADPVRNAWIYEPKIEVYVRKAVHFAHGKVWQTLDVANVEVEENSRRQGVFKTWLRKAERVCPFEAVYVENVQNPVLDEFLIREGYSRISIGFADSYIKPIPALD